MFKGSMVAIVTPFKNGKVDEKALGDLIEFQIKNGTDVIVPCGTTGESATLSHEEHHRVVEFTVKTVNKRVPVVAGAGSNSTSETIDLANYAKKAGADGVLLITPYYNKPTQEGLFLHFKKVTESVDIPVILYNVPGRTSVNMLPSTVARLRTIKNIVGIKEATGDLKQISELIRLCGRDFDVISGDDFTTLPMLAIGGVGAISVTTNIVPARRRGHVRRVLRRKDGRGAQVPLQDGAAPRTDVHRDEPHPGEDVARAHGQDRRGIPAAALSHGRREQGQAQEGAEGLRIDLDAFHHRGFTAETAENELDKPASLAG